MRDEPLRSEIDLFSRDGHLSMLSLDRFEVGELSSRGCDVIIEHLRACNRCSGRFDAVRAAEDVTPRSAGVPSHWARGAAIGGLLVAAAAVLTWGIPEPQQASLKQTENVLSASSYSTTAIADGNPAVAAPGAELRIWIGEAGHGREASSGDDVAWDDPLIIEFEPKRAGYATILVTTDFERSDADANDADGTGGPAWGTEVRVLMPVHAIGPRQQPIRLDDPTEPVRVGDADERFIGVVCPDTFELDPDPTNLETELASLAEECTIQEVALHRSVVCRR